MDFNQYQSKAYKTIQRYNANEIANIVRPFLGIVGQAGSVISELKKKLRDGESYVNFKINLKEELGDVLWYISVIASENEIELEEIASLNLNKVQDRFSPESNTILLDYDEGYPEGEQLPGVVYPPENGLELVCCF